MWPAAVHRYKEYTSLSQGQAWSCALHQPMACEQIWHRPWSRSSSRKAAGWSSEKAMFEVATAAWVPWSKPQTNHSPNATGKKPMHWGPETSGCSSHLGLLTQHPWKLVILLQMLPKRYCLNYKAQVCGWSQKGEKDMTSPLNTRLTVSGSTEHKFKLRQEVKDSGWTIRHYSGKGWCLNKALKQGSLGRWRNLRLGNKWRLLIPFSLISSYPELNLFQWKAFCSMWTPDLHRLEKNPKPTLKMASGPIVKQFRVPKCPDCCAEVGAWVQGMWQRRPEAGWNIQKAGQGPGCLESWWPG